MLEYSSSYMNIHPTPPFWGETIKHESWLGTAKSQPIRPSGTNKKNELRESCGIQLLFPARSATKVLSHSSFHG
ncbi:MAG: hypothetical protein D3909_06620, partial [Candidatus Electrothrix sp. ATG1]|nr:hypothetical protein [Candidatus Electrothrix sp. ATG1]